ncbi:MAG: CAAX prenyl protease-related protein [Desulfuromonadaceae bacterium]|nr:CAAX prenyl protease-related protein [Desulfuromonas sp.]MDY0185423.1 CAAX prenyl protease-related protein [Desulfuromonadaceae bacterium]
MSNNVREVRARVLPFLVFMLFVGVEELLRFSVGKDFSVPDQLLLFLYPVKAGIVAILLLMLWPNYREFRFGDILQWQSTLLSTLIGLFIFWLWIQMTAEFATVGESAGLNVEAYQEGFVRNTMIGVRLCGAVLVVPLMEELFWRSFLIRYLVKKEFMQVSIGMFTWFSFLATAVLFGLEHNLYLAGICAGILFNLVLYRTRSIFQCVLSHAVANLALGIYVLNSGNWHFW